MVTVYVVQTWLKLNWIFFQQLKLDKYLCMVIVLPKSVYVTAKFLFHCRVLAQMRDIKNFVWRTCSLQYLSAPELWVCLMLQQLLSSFREDCVQDVRKNSSYVAIVQRCRICVIWMMRECVWHRLHTVLCSLLSKYLIFNDTVLTNIHKIHTWEIVEENG